MKRIRIPSEAVRVLSIILCPIVALLLVVNVNAAESETLTTIILINGEAELVDLGSEGKILKRYIAVPDYFSSPSSHSSIVKRSLNRYRDLSAKVNNETKELTALSSRELGLPEVKSQNPEPERSEYCITTSELYIQNKCTNDILSTPIVTEHFQDIEPYQTAQAPSPYLSLENMGDWYSDIPLYDVSVFIRKKPSSKILDIDQFI